MNRSGQLYRSAARACRAILDSLKHRIPLLLLKEMREDWDSRAQTEPMSIIATWRNDWTKDEFFASGDKDVEKFTADYLRMMNCDLAQKRMLEIGCGIGRMTRAFAKKFGEVHALDVSQVMIEKGKSLHHSWKNIFWTVGNGVDLKQYSDGYFDFCFSYIVFQHIPTSSAIFNYVREMGRVLKQGGLFKFQVQNNTLAKRFILKHSNKIPLLRRKVIITAQKYDTWGGAYIDETKLRAILRKSGMEITELTGQGTQYMWISGRKL